MQAPPMQTPPGFSHPGPAIMRIQGAPVFYGGFWIRFAAYIVDYVLLTVMAFVALFLMMAGVGLGAGGTYLGMVFLCMLLVSLLYFPLFHASAWQATPGKRVMGLRVMRVDGQDVSFLRAVGRHLAEVLSALVFMIGYLMIGMTRQKTGLHDLIAGTRVVYGRTGA